MSNIKFTFEEFEELDINLRLYHAITITADGYAALRTVGGTAAGGGDMLKSENLSGLENYVTARSNLDVYSTTEVDNALSNKSDTSHNHNLADLSEKSYNSLTDRPDLSVYELLSNKGVANGYAGLDSNGLVPTAQLPGYIDDVLEYDTLANFPDPGEAGKIYVALDTNLTYRWGGSAYVEISSDTQAVWGNITGTLSDQTDLQNALNGKSDTSHTHTELHTHSNKAILDNIIDSGDGTSYLANDGTYKSISGGAGGIETDIIHGLQEVGTVFLKYTSNGDSTVGTVSISLEELPAGSDFIVTWYKNGSQVGTSTITTTQTAEASGDYYTITTLDTALADKEVFTGKITQVGSDEQGADFSYKASIS